MYLFWSNATLQPVSVCNVLSLFPHKAHLSDVDLFQSFRLSRVERVLMLRKMSSFSAPVPDMLTAYKTFVRSILEQSCVIWYSSITEEDREDLERVQKNACRNILKEKYLNYELSLLSLK